MAVRGSCVGMVRHSGHQRGVLSISTIPQISTTFLLPTSPPLSAGQPPTMPSSAPKTSSTRDIFRILTRGTNIKASASKPTANLPSAGAQANPQLFHDEVRGQKRKRNGVNQAAEEKEDEELPDVDFFAPKKEVQKAEKKAKREESPKRVQPTERLSVEECRQVLKSHRIKITLMNKHEERTKVKKSKKKKKDVAVVETSKKDEKKQQLAPQPLESFSQLRTNYDIPKRVSENLVHQGFREPTEVQLGSLPTLLRPDLALQDEEGLEGVESVDFLAVAPTGSGKTISFLIAAINSIVRRRAADEKEKHDLEAVIVAPTRELAHQIVNEGNKLVLGTGIKIVGMKRGMAPGNEWQDIAEDAENASDESEAESEEEEEDDSKPQKKPTRRVKADILVTTPQLLLNSFTSTPNLPTVRDLILDEADVLLDQLFREQTLKLWTACTNPDLRISCWSATMGSNIETLMTDKIESRAKALGVTPRPLVRLVVGLKDTAVPNITHKLLFAGNEQGKLLAMRTLIRPTSKEDIKMHLPFLVFTDTIERATALHEELKYDIPVSAGGSSRIAALHSGLSDFARTAIVRKFRAGEIWLLITTDLLARGLDFRGVNGVVNYDVPNSAAAYVHRAGRTGRAGREGGMAVTLWTHDDVPILKTVANVIVASERQAKKSEEESAVPKWLLERLPDVSKENRKKLKSGKKSEVTGDKDKPKGRITSTSGFERQKEHNRQGAIEANKKRRGDAKGASTGGDDDEWGGFDD